ncbi:MAG: hypothetical protein IJ735_00435 [Clostridia bacterium]|nr:hypothetical protein [Clostridia bacterium]
MIKIIYGEKGSGKTKKILDGATQALAASKGDVVFVAATSRYRMEIKPQIRFIDAVEEGINTKDGLIGFVKGLLCGNYDIEYIFIDGFYKMMGVEIDSPESAEFFLALDRLAGSVNFVLTVSCDLDKMPAYIKKYID